MLYSFCRINIIAILNLFFNFKVYGRENVPRKGGFILACNHASLLDPMVAGAACPRKLNFIARHSLFRNPLFGLLISNVGAFPIVRGSADVGALKEALRRLAAGKGLLIFPQGTRESSGSAGKLLSGIGFLASKSGVPVIPTFINGSQKALPKGARYIRPAPITVRFGKKFFLERGLPYDRFAEEIMLSIGRLSCT